MNSPKRFALVVFALILVVLGVAYEHQVAKGGTKTAAAYVGIPVPSDQHNATQLLDRIHPSAEICKGLLTGNCVSPCYWSQPSNCWWHYDPCPTLACGYPLPKQERHWRCWVYCTGEAWCSGSYWIQIYKECVNCG